MQDENAIEACIERIVAGETENILSLFPRLADAILFTPAITVMTGGDKGTKRIKVATFSSEGRSIVPTFTSEEYFIEWSAGKHQCFSVAGGDLAMTLPQDTWLVINPGRASSLELSPEQLSILAEADLTEQARMSANDKASSDSYAEQNDYSEPSESEFLSDQSEEVCADLRLLFNDFPEVDEGYYQPGDNSDLQGVVGLLTNHLDAERRFILVDQIAEISRKYFGAAGAIEVYDDLGVKSSSSWELFKALVPFYSK